MDHPAWRRPDRWSEIRHPGDNPPGVSGEDARFEQRPVECLHRVGDGSEDLDRGQLARPVCRICNVSQAQHVINRIMTC